MNKFSLMFVIFIDIYRLRVRQHLPMGQQCGGAVMALKGRWWVGATLSPKTNVPPPNDTNDSNDFDETIVGKVARSFVEALG